MNWNDGKWNLLNCIKKFNSHKEISFVQIVHQNINELNL